MTVQGVSITGAYGGIEIHVDIDPVWLGMK
jgi:hypothetical protein